MFFGFYIVFVVIRGMWNKKLGLPFRYSLKRYDIRLEDDERETAVTGIAYKHAFDTVLWGLISSLLFLSIVHMNQNTGGICSFVDTYVFACWLIVASLILGLLSFSYKWCTEYNNLFQRD